MGALILPASVQRAYDVGLLGAATVTLASCAVFTAGIFLLFSGLIVAGLIGFGAYWLLCGGRSGNGKDEPATKERENAQTPAAEETAKTDTVAKRDAHMQQLLGAAFDEHADADGTLHPARFQPMMRCWLGGIWEWQAAENEDLLRKIEQQREELSQTIPSEAVLKARGVVGLDQIRHALRPTFEKRPLSVLKGPVERLGLFALLERKLQEEAQSLDNEGLPMIRRLLTCMVPQSPEYLRAEFEQARQRALEVQEAMLTEEHVQQMLTSFTEQTGRSRITRDDVLSFSAAKRPPTLPGGESSPAARAYAADSLEVLDAMLQAGCSPTKMLLFDSVSDDGGPEE